MMATFVRCIDEWDNTFLLSISALADALRPLLQPAPADVADITPVDPTVASLATDLALAWEENKRLRRERDEALGFRDDYIVKADRLEQQVAQQDARAQRAELALADARQEIATLRQQRDAYRAQADAARQAATEAAQRADAAEAKLAAFHSPRAAVQD
jgi:chromosome segregation ATPase